MSTTTADRDAADAADRPPPGRPQPGAAYYARKALKALASLQLTVVLFALSIGLVFLGTLAQIDFGIWTVVDQYFWSWVVWVPGDLFNKFGQVFLDFPKGGQPWGWKFPFPSGKLLGGAMLLNLLAAHATRFRFTWKRAGVLLIHSGLILLFAGEFVTREYAVEQRMTIDEGTATAFTEDTRTVELAFVDKSNPAEDVVTVIPEEVLRKPAGRISYPDLPVDVEVIEYMVNSTVERAGGIGKANPATAGVGKEAVAVRRPEVSGVDPNQKIDTPSAYVKFYRKGTDTVVGTYLVSLRLALQKLSDTLDLDGKAYDLSMRFKRYYKPYSLYLIKFRFDRYPGTNKPKNFSSEVVLRDPEQGVERELTIRMNDPLRHRGETFYQGSYDEETERTTILQVVKNPGWLIPYVSCVVVTAGMLLHFGLYLTRFLTRRAAA